MASTAARVQPGSYLTLHYRLAGPDGDIINTFEGKPSTMPLGTGALSPALEERLIGLEEGVRTRFDIPAGQAFGDRNPDMVQWVARKLLAQMGDPHESYHVGDVVQFPTPDGLGQYAGAVQQAGQAAEAGQHFVGHLEDAAATGAGAQEQGEQFDIAEGGGAAGQQFFPGPDVGGEVFERHHGAPCPDFLEWRPV